MDDERSRKLSVSALDSGDSLASEVDGGLERYLVGFGPDEWVAWQREVPQEVVDRLAGLLDHGGDHHLVHEYELTGEALRRAAHLAGFTPRPDLTYVLSTVQASHDRPIGPVLRDIGRVNDFFRLETQQPAAGWGSVTGDGLTEERLADEVGRVRSQLATLSGAGPESVEWRVGASLFHQGLASRLLSPVLAAGVCHGAGLSAPDFFLDTRREGPLVLRTVELRVPELSGPADVAAWLEESVVGRVLAPVENALTRVGRISAGLLRGNTGAALAGAARALGRERPEQRGGAERVARLMLERDALSGTGAYTGTDPEGLAVFRRSTCCLYYRLPDGGLCGDCALRP